jgi:hypothetical protein
MRMNSEAGGFLTMPPASEMRQEREYTPRYIPYTGHKPPKILNRDDFPHPIEYINLALIILPSSMDYRLALQLVDVAGKDCQEL